MPDKMISKDQNQACLEIGNEASKKEEWIDYAQYCFLREKGLRKKAFNRISIPIPRIFRPFLEEGPFETCLICGCGLLQPGVHYMIEKAFRGTEVIFEYAICLSCSQNLHKELSAESLQRLRRHFEEHVDWEERDKRLLKTSRGRCEPWLQHCVITGTPRDQAHAYHLIGHCAGDKLVLMFHPFMICEAAMIQMERLISKKTRDALDNFTDQYLGMPPEFRGVFNDAPMLLV
jgi:hypothetical protein